MCDRPTPQNTRREDVDAAPCRLADGALWGFATPALRLFPVVEESTDDFGRRSESIRARAEIAYPVDIQRLLDGLLAACAGGSTARQHDAFLELAGALLRRAHDIDRATARRLLGVGRDALPGLIHDVLTAALRRRPEPTALAQGEPPDG